jgi:hypothetical protein
MPPSDRLDIVVSAQWFRTKLWRYAPGRNASHPQQNEVGRTFHAPPLLDHFHPIAQTENGLGGRRERATQRTPALMQYQVPSWT